MIRSHLGYIDFDYRPGKGGSAPAPPNPQTTIAQQEQENKNTAQNNLTLNSGSVFTPLGSSTFTPRYDSNSGMTIYDQNVTLDPTQQKLLDTQNQQDLSLGNLSNALVDQAGAQYAKPMDTSGLPALQSLQGNAGDGVQRTLSTDGLPQLMGADDLEGARKSVSDALYGRQTAYLDPQYQQREDQLRTRLAAQGITQNSEAWNNAEAELGRSRSFDYGQARDSAISGGLNEMTGLAGIASSNRGQLFGERTAQGDFQNQASAQALQDAIARIQQNNATRGQGFQEQSALRDMPLNELNAIRSSTAVNVPQFQGAPQATIQGTDVAGITSDAYQKQLDIYNAQQKSKNGMLSGLMGLAGTVGGAFIGGPAGAAIGGALAKKVSGG